MLIIFLLFILVAVLFPIKKKNRILNLIALGLYLLLIIEMFCFGYILYLISNDKVNFYLTNNQKFYDLLIKNRIISKIYESKNNPYSTYEINEDLGFTVGKDKYTYQYKTTNSQRMRADRDYPLIPDHNTFRIAALGDSYVFCDGELTQNCWTYGLEQSVSNLEVLNFGVSGYGLSQSYLRYIHEAIRFHPDLIIINYFFLTDRDSFNPWRILEGSPVYQADMYRPILWMDKGRLKYKTTSPLDLFNPEFVRKNLCDKTAFDYDNSFWSNRILSLSNIFVLFKYHYLPRYVKTLPQYKGRGEAIFDEEFSKTLNIYLLDHLLSLARYNRSMVLFTGNDYTEFPPHLNALIQKYSDIILFYAERPIIHQLAERQKIKDIYNETNHYNPAGNMLYAQSILYYLASKEWDRFDRKFIFDKKKNSFIRLE